MSRSCEMEYPLTAIRSFTFFKYHTPSQSQRSEGQILGLGLGLVKFSVTHRCTDTAAKKVLMIRAKTVISVSSFPP